MMATIAQAIRMALAYGEQHLDLKDVFGQDVGPPLGGVFTATQGLKTAWNSPLDERGIIGMATGLGLAGSRCVAEIQFCDYIFNTIDLLKLCGGVSWASGGQFAMPVVVMTPVGSGIHGSIFHSHSFDATMTRIPGWKIVIPSTARDAFGLMLSALREHNPVMYLVPKALIRAKGPEPIDGEPDERELKAMIDAPLGDRSKWQPRWPTLADPQIPIGKAKMCLQGDAATIVSWGRTMPLAIEAARKIAEEDGRQCDVLDLRTLYPYDWPAISASIKRTGKVLFINEDTEVTNFGEHLVRRTCDDLFYHLHARPRLIAGKHVPGIGLSPALEYATTPQGADIEKAIRELVFEQA